MVRSAAMTYAAKQVRVNAVAPGLVQTPLTEKIWGNPRSAEVSLSMHPVGRFGQPEDIARAILWLASPEQSWVTGQTIGVDGGLGKLKELSQAYGWGYAVADGTDWIQLDGVVSSAEGLLGGINAAINLAGSVLLKPMHLTSRAEWDATLGANLTSAAGLLKSCVPRMLANGGSVVLMSSAAASIG